MSKGTGLRYNTGKPRLGLLPAFAMRCLARVLTKGAAKYTVKDEQTGEIKVDGSNNWRGGMPWMDVIDSAERHINAWKSGEDYDPETGELHLSHGLCNLAFLVEYYKIFPQGDNRPHHYLKTPRIGLDLDDVIANFTPSFCEEVGVPVPTSWYFGFPELVKQIKDYPAFMLNLPVKIKPEDIPFEPVCYITTRDNKHVEPWVAEAWLEKNGYPKVRVIQTDDKVAAAKEMNLDIFVDDSYSNFVKLNAAGVCCYLFDSPPNRKYNVGTRRIYSLRQLVDFTGEAPDRRAPNHDSPIVKAMMRENGIMNPQPPPGILI